MYTVSQFLVFYVLNDVLSMFGNKLFYSLVFKWQIHIPTHLTDRNTLVTITAI